jgi:hypothetical protein
MRPALRTVLFGARPNVLLNGGFDTDTNWSKGTGWTISGGVAVKAPGTGSILGQAAAGVAGRTYNWSMTLTVVAGSVTIGWVGTAGNVFSASISTSGTHTGTLVASASSVLTTIRVTADAAFDGTVDDVSVR